MTGNGHPSCLKSVLFLLGSIVYHSFTPFPLAVRVDIECVLHWPLHEQDMLPRAAGAWQACGCRQCSTGPQALGWTHSGSVRIGCATTARWPGETLKSWTKGMALPGSLYGSACSLPSSCRFWPKCRHLSEALIFLHSLQHVPTPSSNTTVISVHNFIIS